MATAKEKAASPAPEPEAEASEGADVVDGTVTMEMPKGFVPQGAQAAPWWKIEEGAVLRGHIRGALFTMQDQRRTEYFQVQVTEPATGQEGTIAKGNRKDVPVARGGLVSVSVRKRMEILKEKILLEQQAGAIYEIWIKIGKKEGISGGRTFWPMQIATKCVKQPNARVGDKLIGTVSDSAPTEIDDEDLPF